MHRGLVRPRSRLNILYLLYKLDRLNLLLLLDRLDGLRLLEYLEGDGLRAGGRELPGAGLLAVSAEGLGLVLVEVEGAPVCEEGLDLLLVEAVVEEGRGGGVAVGPVVDHLLQPGAPARVAGPGPLALPAAAPAPGPGLALAEQVLLQPVELLVLGLELVPGQHLPQGHLQPLQVLGPAVLPQQVQQALVPGLDLLPQGQPVLPQDLL